MTRNDFKENISQALDEMKKEQGSSFDLSKVNLAELERRTGISRSKLRRLKRNDFVFKVHGNTGHKPDLTVLSGFEKHIDELLTHGVSNSNVCFERIKDLGYQGSKSTLKRYIQSHKHLLPPKRQVVSSQGNR